MSRFDFVAALLTISAVGCSSQTPSAAAPDASSVVFNEISAAGDEWLELYNQGDSTFDLGSYALADTDKTTGAPRTTKAMRFPTGSKLAKGGYLLVLMGKDNSTPGPYSAEACLAGVSSGCFYGMFSLSEARGEAVHLLAPDNTTLSSTNYPADLEFEAGSGLTACRLPDGSGDLTTCAATPAAPNAAP